MNFLRMLVPAVMCVLLFNLAESKNEKVTNKKNIKPQDKSKKLELKNQGSIHTHKEDALSSGEHIAQRTKESIDAKKNASRNDRNGGHKSKAEHKSLDNDTREKQTGQSKTKEQDDVLGKTRAVSNGKKTAKPKDKAKNKKENLKNRNDKDNVKNHKKNDSQRKKADNKNNKSKSDEKPGNATVSANKTELQRAIPTNCNDIVDQYTNGKILMFEYKIKMKRCMAKKDDTKRTQLPAIPSASASSNQPWQPAQTPVQQVQPLVQQSPAANFLPTQDQQQLASQPQVSMAQQAPATLNSYNALPGPDSFPQTQSLQNANPFGARSEVPNPVSAPAAPTMDDSTQAQAVLDQWRSNSFGASASKKSEVSGAQIAQFLNSQQPSTSQGLSAQPLATQERNQIQPQPFQQQTNILPQSIEQRSSIQPQPQPAQLQPQQAAFNQSPAGPEANLPF